MGGTHREALLDLLRWRRDVRHFRRDPLDDAVLERLREAMELAPSVGNARPWRVIRVRNAGLRMAVRADFARCNAEAAKLLDQCDRQDYARLKLAGLDDAPEQLAVFTETEPTEGRGLGRRTMPTTLEQSTVMAIHTLWLAARAENIGIGMVSILDPARIAALFEVPESWRFTAYLCMGYPEFDDDTPLLHRADWQKNSPTRWQDC